MSYVTKLKCIDCGREYSAEEPWHADNHLCRKLIGVDSIALWQDYTAEGVMHGYKR
jgi:hypothetical protein